MTTTGKDGSIEFSNAEHEAIDRLSTSIQLMFVASRATLPMCTAVLSELLLVAIFEMSKPKTRQEAEKFLNEFVDVSFRPSIQIFVDGLFDKRENIFKKEFH